MKPKDYFLHHGCTAQKHYEALKAFYLEGLRAEQVALQFGFTTAYFKKLRFEFAQKLKQGENPFFQEKKPGPKHDEAKARDQIDRHRPAGCIKNGAGRSHIDQSLSACQT